MKKLIFLQSSQFPHKDNVKKVFDIKEKETLYFTLLITEAALYSIDLEFNLIGKDSFLFVYVIQYGVSNQALNLNISNIHKSERSTGKIFIRRVMKDSSSSFINGKLIMEKEAQNSSDFFDEKTLILGDRVVSKVIPSLEIIPSNVFVSHSSSIAPIPENYLFYLQSRGILSDDAYSMIERGFMLSCIDNILDKKIREEIKNKVSLYI